MEDSDGLRQLDPEARPASCLEILAVLCAYTGLKKCTFETCTLTKTPQS